jgi:hypothetical protein
VEPNELGSDLYMDTVAVLRTTGMRRLGIVNSTVSISVASPAVFTSVVTVATGTPFTLSTSGTLPTGLTPGVTYYAIASTGTSFNVSLTAGGAAINTTGAGSGTHDINPNGVLLSSLAGSDGYAPLTTTQ